ncbi:MAG: energy transducer TonB [Fusobacteriaceae bacterium]
MKKVDVFSFSVALIINVLILLLLPGVKTPEVVGKIKVGLISTGSKKNVAYEGKKENESKKPPIPKEPEPPVVKSENIPVKEIKKELSLDNLAITAPVMNNALGKKSVKAKKITSSSQSKQVSDALDAPIKTIGSVAGVPSGYKLGATDGDIDAEWDSNNRNPEYPISAQQKGINGSVTLYLNIDSRGNVRSVTFKKRSGYTEIDNAIELVARSWKIYLSKNSKIVQGDVFLDYNFKLIGN